MRWLVCVCLSLALFSAYSLGEYDRPRPAVPDYSQEPTEENLVTWLEYARYSHQFYLDNPQYDKHYNAAGQHHWVRVYDMTIEILGSKEK